jgi:hypothetical protein
MKTRRENSLKHNISQGIFRERFIELIFLKKTFEKVETFESGKLCLRNCLRKGVGGKKEFRRYKRRNFKGRGRHSKRRKSFNYSSKKRVLRKKVSHSRERKSLP